MKSVRNGFLTAILSFTATASFAVAAFAAAEAPAPVCPAYGRPLPINNEQILHWKRTTPNQFRERGNVKGVVTRIFPDKTNHDHFEIAIGKRYEDVIEVIYNSDFGQIPQVKPGDVIQACGDFIVATAQSGPYPPSPSGAIIHWIHMNPSGKGHDPGFLMINGALYGQDATHAGPGRRPYPPRNRQSDGRRQGRNSFVSVETRGERSNEASFETSYYGR